MKYFSILNTKLNYLNFMLSQDRLVVQNPRSFADNILGKLFFLDCHGHDLIQYFSSYGTTGIHNCHYCQTAVTKQKSGP